MSKPKLIIPIAVVGLAAAGWLAWRALRGDSADAAGILLHGNVELTEIDLSFKTPGRIAELPWREGDRIKAGEVVARLERAEALQVRERELATVAFTQSNLAQLLTAIEYQRSSIDGELALRQAEVDQAEARLRELVSGTRQQELAQARAAVAEATTLLEQAASDWERARRLYKNEDISTAQHDQFRTRHEAAAAAAERARQAFSLAAEGARAEQVEQARAAVARARAALTLAQAARIDLKRREQELGARRADVDRAKAQAAVAEVQVNDRTLLAPTAGVVFTKSAEPGEVIAAGSTVLTLGDLERPWVRAYAGERDLARLRLGMGASVTTDSYPGKVYRGKLTYIASEAEFTPKQIQTLEERVKLVYRLKIAVDNPQGELKAGMPADAVLRPNGK